MTEFDVIVVGGGPAGVAAATQAGRAGARTLLVEKSSRLGGVTVNAGINRPGLFHAWGRQIIGGIGWELVERAVLEGGTELPDFADVSLPFHLHQPFVDPMVYAHLCDVFVLEAGCDLLLHTMIAEAHENNHGWTVRLCGKGGLTTVSARQLVDCTGDANVVSLAGYPLRVQREWQPATLDCELGGYDPDAIDIDAINAEFRYAIERGEVMASDGCWREDMPDVTFLRSRGRNANHIVVGVNQCDSAGRTAVEIEGRRSVYRMVRFLRRQPGLENLRVVRMSAEVGVRETVTIRGEATVRLEDYQSGRLWEDAVSYSFYPIDLHGVDSKSWQLKPLPNGTIATIPRGALLPVESRNLTVAGRAFSSDRYANSAGRVQASCMAMGQAAGVLAFLGAETGLTPADVPISTVTDLLRKHGAIVPPDLT